MNGVKAWWIGFFLIIFFILFSEFVALSHDYVLNRLGINRDYMLIFLWIIPIISSFIAVFFQEKNGALIGLSYIPVLSILGPLFYLFIDGISTTVNFGNISDLKIAFKIYFVLILITVSIGCLAGIIFKKIKSIDNK